MNEREALRLALEALEEIAKEATTAFEDAWCGDIANDALTAIKQALEQPEPEPVAWLNDCEEIHFDKEDAFRYSNGFIQPLYTSPPKREQWTDEMAKVPDHVWEKREPLTDEQIEDEWERITGHSIFGGDRSEGRPMYISPDEVTEFTRAIEAAHGIKGEA